MIGAGRDKKPQEKTSHGLNDTGQNDTNTKRNRTNDYTDKMSQGNTPYKKRSKDRMPHGQNVTRQKITHMKRRTNKMSQEKSQTDKT